MSSQWDKIETMVHNLGWAKWVWLFNAVLFGSVVVTYFVLLALGFLPEMPVLFTFLLAALAVVDIICWGQWNFVRKLHKEMRKAYSLREKKVQI